MIRGRMMKMGWGDKEMGRQGDGEDRYRTADCHPIILPSIVLPLSSDTIQNHCPPKDAPRIPSPSV